MKVKSLFISDLHLGTRHSNIESVKYVLKNIECENLFLVGDIIDFWALRTKFYMPKEHWSILSKIIKKAKNGTNVVYIYGNHDDIISSIPEDSQEDINNIKFCEHYIYKNIYICHGQQFDLWTRNYTIFCRLGDIGYALCLYLNRMINKFYHVSLSSIIKKKAKELFIPNFYKASAKLAKQNNCDIIINGHIHYPGQILINEDNKDITVYNVGDFIDHDSFIIELDDGTLKLCDLNWLKNNI